MPYTAYFPWATLSKIWNCCSVEGTRIWYMLNIYISLSRLRKMNTRHPLSSIVIVDGNSTSFFPGVKWNHTHQWQPDWKKVRRKIRITQGIRNQHETTTFWKTRSSSSSSSSSAASSFSSQLSSFRHNYHHHHYHYHYNNYYSYWNEILFNTLNYRMLFITNNMNFVADNSSILSELISIYSSNILILFEPPSWDRFFYGGCLKFSVIPRKTPTHRRQWCIEMHKHCPPYKASLSGVRGSTAIQAVMYCWRHTLDDGSKYKIRSH